MPVARQAIFVGPNVSLNELERCNLQLVYTMLSGWKDCSQDKALIRSSARKITMAEVV